MIIHLRGIQALQQLRIAHQKSAGLEFRASCLKEMLFLYEVCKHPELPMFQAHKVPVAPAWKRITDSINSPVGYATGQLVNSVPWR